MKKNEVYIVTSGEYEHYHIDEIFSKKEDAERYCHERNTNEYEKYEVEEMTLDNYDFKPLIYFLDIQHSYRKDMPVVVNLRHEDYERDTDIEVSKYSDKIRVFINMGIGLPEDINYEYYIKVFKELQELRDCGKDKEHLLDNLNKKLLNNMDIKNKLIKYGFVKKHDYIYGLEEINKIEFFNKQIKNIDVSVIVKECEIEIFCKRMHENKMYACGGYIQNGCYEDFKEVIKLITKMNMSIIDKINKV